MAHAVVFLTRRRPGPQASVAAVAGGHMSVPPALVGAGAWACPQPEVQQRCPPGPRPAVLGRRRQPSAGHAGAQRITRSSFSPRLRRSQRVPQETGDVLTFHLP